MVNNFKLAKKSIFFFGLILIQCQTLKSEYVKFKTEVEYYESTSLKSNKINKILFNKLKKKPNSFVSVSNDNLTENIRFHLTKQNFVVELTNVKIVTSEELEEPMDIETNKIKSVLQEINYDILLDGYLYEKNIGNILDEKVTTGIIIKAYNNQGKLIGKFVLNSSLSVEDFENNFLLSGLVGAKINKVLRSINDEGSIGFFNFFK